MRRARRSDRPDRRRRGARLQPQRGLVPGRRTRENPAGRQRDGHAPPARRRARHRRARLSRRAARATPASGGSDRGAVRAGAGARGGADRRRCRLDDAAGAPAARARRRALHLRQHRFRARPEVELHQYRLPASDAARTARRRHRPRRPERSARALPGRGRQGRAPAGGVHGRQPSHRFSRRRRLDAADGRARGDRRGARRGACRWSNA